MKLLSAVILLACSITLLSCKNRFKEGIEKTPVPNAQELIKNNGKIMLEAIENSRSSINAKAHIFPELSRKADTLYNAFDNVRWYIEVIETTLRENDPKLSSKGIANELLVKGPYGDTLTNVMLNLYKSVIACPVSTITKHTIPQLMKDIRLLAIDPDRKKYYFESAKTSAAINSLEGIKLMAIFGTSFVMSDLNTQAH
jgi:hypothetical protein